MKALGRGILIFLSPASKNYTTTTLCTSRLPENK